MMRGASLGSVVELLGHQSMKMTMRYADLSPVPVGRGQPGRSAAVTVAYDSKGQGENEKGKKRAKRSRERFYRDRSARSCYVLSER
jgi:hypothetical protein